MWPWTRREPAEDDLRTLRADLKDLQADVRRLEAEWQSMYDKLVRRDERLRKREERAQAGEPLPDGRKAALWARVRSQPHQNGRT